MNLIKFDYQKGVDTQTYYLALDKNDNTYYHGYDLVDKGQYKTFLKSKISHCKLLQESVEKSSYVISKNDLVFQVEGIKLAPNTLKYIDYELLRKQAEKTLNATVKILDNNYYLVQPIKPKKNISLYTWTYDPSTKKYTETISYNDGSKTTQNTDLTNSVYNYLVEQIFSK